MPRYFFHLRFGERLVPDEEGVELLSRTAARDEARAVVRDLADPEIGGNPRRWASWFLDVADDEGAFCRTPIGHPALQVVSPDGDRLRPELVQSAATASWPRETSCGRRPKRGRSRPHRALQRCLACAGAAVGCVQCAAWPRGQAVPLAAANA